jgi:hypothetical protein
MEDNEMKQMEQRVKRYWYTDGIAELTSGGLFVLLGVYFGAQGFLGEGSTASIILQISLILVMVGGIFGVRWLVNDLKTRLTYPRTGYVEYRVNEKNVKVRRYLVAGVAMTIAIASIVLVDYIRGLDTMALITGLLVGVIFIALRGKSSGLKRFYLLGVLAMVLGVTLSFSGLSQAYNLGLLYGLLGIAVMFSGGLVLRRYLSENPLPPENGHE